MYSLALVSSITGTTSRTALMCNAIQLLRDPTIPAQARECKVEKLKSVLDMSKLCRPNTPEAFLVHICLIDCTSLASQHTRHSPEQTSNQINSSLLVCRKTWWLQLHSRTAGMKFYSTVVPAHEGNPFAYEQAMKHRSKLLGLSLEQVGMNDSAMCICKQNRRPQVTHT